MTKKSKKITALAPKKKSAKKTKANATPLMASEQGANIVDLILLDHKFLKECIETLTDEVADRTEVAKVGKSFLAVLEKHAVAEEKTIYPELEKVKKFRFNILESEVEHGIVDQKVKYLKPKVSRVTKANDELAAELKVCAELVKHHIREEESELLPKVNEELSTDLRMEMGMRFAKARGFTLEELKEFPKLPVAIQGWRNEMQELSQKFMSRMDKLVESFR